MEQPGSRPSPIPPANTDDAEDVAWALSTAEAMYARGDRTDALKWLRRATEAASEGDTDDRALELAKATAELASEIAPVPSSPPSPPASSPTPVSDPVATSRLPSEPGPPNPLLANPLVASPGLDHAPAVAAAWTPDDDTRVGPSAHEVSNARRATPRTAQAIRVVLWRDADGVRIAPEGTRVAAISVEAILVALDPSADLAAWLDDPSQAAAGSRHGDGASAAPADAWSKPKE